MLDAAVACLRCPHCGGDLTADARTLRCAAGHAFDLARQGYVNLLGGDARPAGDTVAMVAARNAFLRAGHYAPIGDAVAAACAAAAPAGDTGCVVDLGAGTGWYLAHVLDRLPGRAGLALDRSVPALRRAARAHPRIGAAACDTWRALPVRTGAAALALIIFAPRNGAELRRVLVSDGTLVLVTPTAGHLAELRTALDLLRVDPRKSERLATSLEPHLDPGPREQLEWQLALDRDAVAALVAMGPSAWHADPARLAARIAELPTPLTVTASVTVGTYRRP